MTALKDGIHFLRAAIRSPARVGAIAPSSSALAERMMDGIELARGQSVVELGPGTGPITRVIHQRLGRHADYLGIELEFKFVKLLTHRFPHLKFVQGSAEHALELIERADIGPVRAIISGLPFASLPLGMQDRILDNLHELMIPGVVFRTFQYVHAWMLPSAIRFRKRMNHRFGACRVSRPVLANIPPAVVLSWQA
jgi:phospholipid N-methyltransferase